MRIWIFTVVLFFLMSPVWAGPVNDSYQGRDMLVYVPAQLPAKGQRALVVALHGGMGNANSLQKRLNMDSVAEKNGFIVAYLNGTAAGRLISARMRTWNAGGGCCGQSFRNNVDDVNYISGAVKYLAQKYGVDQSRVYGMGHSNGAMMSQRMMCETDVYRAIVPISGVLQTDDVSCDLAKGKRILAIHGEADENVPIGGGVGPKGISRVNFHSEAATAKIFTDSGAEYQLQILPGADHSLAHLNAAIQNQEGVSIPEKAAQFFGLTR